MSKYQEREEVRRGMDRIADTLLRRFGEPAKLYKEHFSPHQSETPKAAGRGSSPPDLDAITAPLD